MPEPDREAEILHLAAEFPPVPTADWEAAITKDLKGADYDKKLVWRTEEGIPVRPYYRKEHIEAIGDLADLAPGEFPYTRGSGRSWEEAQEWPSPDSAIRGDLLHDAGATAVQELAFTLAEAVEQVAARTAAGETVEAVVPGIAFAYAVGSNYFFEIAKLRAARTLWAAVISAFGGDEHAAAVTRIHVRTARSNKSTLDPYTNLLRVTTEALSAVIGGCDSLAVEASGFDSHLAHNVQRILREEAHVGRVADPAGGSYYIETLTDAIARQAWTLFQQVEAEGGWSSALQNGTIDKALSASREAKSKAIASRRRTLVGVNNYPNTNEKTPDRSRPAPPLDERFAEFRLAQPFDELRERTVLHSRQTGRAAKILLLKRGDVKMKVARANFCRNFFGCAGFDIVESEEFSGLDVDLIVLCSSDPEYDAFAQEVCPQLQRPVLVAGNPKDQIESLKAAGVQGFVHLFSDAVDTLTYWQDRLGMPRVSRVTREVKESST